MHAGRIREETALKIDAETPSFVVADFLETTGSGLTVSRYERDERIFRQGDAAESVFYLQNGQVKVTVVSQSGKEAIVTLLTKGDFFGEESMGMGEENALRLSTSTAVTECVVSRIAKAEMVRALHDENAFSDFFLKFLVARGIRARADLVDQLFNCAERRLARILLIMAEYGKPGDPKTLIPAVTQEALADMIGTTRSRVSAFMNRFRDLGYIEYNGRIRVHTSLLSLVLYDTLPEGNASRPVLPDPLRSEARTSKQTKPANKN
jgi:CRP-like cAMP-binding protein